MTDSALDCDIAIIGAGFSGAMVKNNRKTTRNNSSNGGLRLGPERRRAESTPEGMNVRVAFCCSNMRRR